MYYFWLFINLLTYHETKAACCRPFNPTDRPICRELSKDVSKCVATEGQCYWNCNEEFDIFQSDLFEKPIFLGFAGTGTTHSATATETETAAYRMEREPPQPLTEEEYVDKMALFRVGEHREWYKFPLKAEAFAQAEGHHRRLVVPGQALVAAVAGGAAGDIATYPYQATGDLVWDDGRTRNFNGVASVIRSHRGHISLLTTGHNCYYHDYPRKADKIGRNYRFFYRLHSNTNTPVVPGVGLTHQAAAPVLHYTEYKDSAGQSISRQHKVDFCVITLPGAANRHLQPAYDDNLAGNFDVATYYQPVSPTRIAKGAHGPANWEQRKFVNLNLIRSGTDLLYKRRAELKGGMSGSPLVSNGHTQRQYGIHVGCTGDNDYWLRITRPKYMIILGVTGGGGTGRGTGSTSGIATAKRQKYNYYKKPPQPLQSYEPDQNKYYEFENNNAREEYQQLLANFHYDQEVENAREERVDRLLDIEKQKIKRLATKYHS